MPNGHKKSPHTAAAQKKRMLKAAEQKRLAEEKAKALKDNTPFISDEVAEEMKNYIKKIQSDFNRLKHIRYPIKLTFADTRVKCRDDKKNKQLKLISKFIFKRAEEYGIPFDEVVDKEIYKNKRSPKICLMTQENFNRMELELEEMDEDLGGGVYLRDDSKYVKTRLQDYFKDFIHVEGSDTMTEEERDEWARWGMGWIKEQMIKRPKINGEINNWNAGCFGSIWMDYEKSPMPNGETRIAIYNCSMEENERGNLVITKEYKTNKKTYRPVMFLNANATPDSRTIRVQ